MGQVVRAARLAAPAAGGQCGRQQNSEVVIERGIGDEIAYSDPGLLRQHGGGGSSSLPARPIHAWLGRPPAV